MKKLMMIAAVVMAMTSVQAANWRWNMSSSSLMYAHGSTQTSLTPFSSSTVTAYIFAYADAESQKAVFNQWYNNGNYGVKSFTGGLDEKKFTDGNVAVDATWEFQTDGTSGSQKFFFALVDDSGNLFISTTKSATVNTGNAGALLSFSAKSPSLYDNGTKTAFATAGWYTAAVPEPTSGLLLILGVAGLALRRRRA